MSYLPTLVPNSNDCKLHNLYDPQSCIIAAVCILIGAAKCFYGKLRSYFHCIFLPFKKFGRKIRFPLTLGLDNLNYFLIKFLFQISLGISFGVGVIAGLLTLCLFYVGLFLLGASMGWFVGMALLPLLYKHSVYLSEHNWLPYIVLSAFAIAGGILILCIQRAVIIISTSFMGAFMFVNGVDYFVENCKALYYTINILHGHHNKSDLPHCWYTWVVFSLIPIMFIAGMIVQFRKTGKDSDHRQ
ncbi:unnamed protein product, partial [Porites evermanni]